MRKITIILFGLLISAIIVVYGVLAQTYPPGSEQFIYVVRGRQIVDIIGILVMVTLLARGLAYMRNQQRKGKK